MEKAGNRLLIDLEVGQKATISGYTNPRIGLHLLSMGLDIGTPIIIKRKTFGGNTLYIQSSSKRYALRKTQAESIEINAFYDKE